MSIVIGCDSFLSLHNVRLGGFARCLNGTEVQAWVDPHQLGSSRLVESEGIRVDSLEDFDARQDRELNRLLARVSQARKCYYDPVTIWTEYLLSSCRSHKTRRWRRMASLGFSAGRLAKFWVAGRIGLATHWRAEFAEALKSHPITNVYRRRLEKARAEVVASFSPEGLREMALIEAANSLGIPTLVMIRSRDNLAAKIPYLPFADSYAVWSDLARQFLLYMYPETPPERVHVTGGVQFDLHLNPSCRLTRDAFFDLMDLDHKRPLILYTMATPGLIPQETAIVQHLANAAHAGTFQDRAQLLVRGHPRMFGSDVKSLRCEYPEAKNYPPPTSAGYGTPEHEAAVVGRILHDEPIHLSSLAYQDVQVNICGTMTIDSAILDKPTVNIFYDLVPDVPSGLSVRRFYRRTDVRQMMAYGASRLAHDPDECIKLINRYLKNPSLDREGRQRARAEDCGPLDGLAGKRTAEALLALQHEHRRLAGSHESMAESRSTVS